MPLIKSCKTTLVVIGLVLCSSIVHSALAAKFSVLIVANSDDYAAGSAIRVGRDRVVSAFEGIASALRQGGTETQVRILEGSDFQLVKLRSVLRESLTVLGKDDTFIFYYIGHGRNENGRDFPFLLVPGPNSEGLLLDEISDAVEDQHIKFSLVVAEACNGFSDELGSEPTSTINTAALLSEIKLDRPIRELFGQSDGSVVIASAAPGQYAAASQLSGPFFTSRFLNVLRNSLYEAAKNNKPAEWKKIVGAVSKSIQFKDWSQQPVFDVQNLRVGSAGDQTASVANPAQSSDKFEQGTSDRREWELWFSSLTGDYRAGAAFWAANRSLPIAASCLGPAGQTLGDWTTGCSAARTRLEVSDRRRLNDPEYRRGWNSI